MSPWGLLKLDRSVGKEKEEKRHAAFIMPRAHPFKSMVYLFGKASQKPKTNNQAKAKISSQLPQIQA
jgi:hypothetical protein